VHAGDALACTDDEWDFAFAINCRAAFKLNQAFLPGMVAQRWGSIIHVSSIASTVRGLPNRFVYGATKAALLGMTKSIAADYVAHNVRCNAICPGTVESPSLQQRIAAQAQAPEAVHAMFVARQPLGRLGTAQEIAAAAVFLASDEGSFTTGAFFNVDGGMVI
jgi:2-keto-3-deoxy-L-fuconate dehydrogenase